MSIALGCITNSSGYDFRKGQAVQSINNGHSAIHLITSSAAYSKRGKSRFSRASVAETTYQIAWKMRAAGHHVGNRLAVIFVARFVKIEKAIQPWHPFGHRLHGL